MFAAQKPIITRNWIISKIKATQNTKCYTKSTIAITPNKESIYFNASHMIERYNGIFLYKHSLASFCYIFPR